MKETPSLQSLPAHLGGDLVHVDNDPQVRCPALEYAGEAAFSDAVDAADYRVNLHASS